MLCSYCYITYLNHNSISNSNKLPFIKYKRWIDIYGNTNIEEPHHFTCKVCKNVYNINHLWIIEKS